MKRFWITTRPSVRKETRAPINNIMKSDPVTIAICAKDRGILGTPGWKNKTIMNIAKTNEKLIRHANQAKLHSFRTKPVCMHGFQAPRNHEQAKELDEQNGDTKWRDAELLKLS